MPDVRKKASTSARMSGVLMPPTVSGYNGHVNIQNFGRAEISGAADKCTMKNGADESWRARLQALVDASGRSMRSISLGAGLAHGYLHSVLKDGTDPSLRALALIMQELESPVVSLFEAQDTTEERNRLQNIARTLTPAQLSLLEGLARQMIEQESQLRDKANGSDTP
jgi:transcriptional regulator with XRE-family HTH domain